MKTFILSLITILLVGSSCSIEEPSFDNIGNFKLNEFKGSHIEGAFDVTVENENKFGFKIKKVEADILIDNQKIGVVRLNNKIKVKRKSNKTYNVPISVDLENGALLLIMKQVTKDEVTVNIKGFAKGSVMGICKKMDFSESKKINPTDFQSLMK